MFDGLSLSDGSVVCSGPDRLFQSLDQCHSLIFSVCMCVCLRKGFPHLPSPQTRSSAESSIRSSPGRSPALCLVNVKIRHQLQVTLSDRRVLSLGF